MKIDNFKIIIYSLILLLTLPSSLASAQGVAGIPFGGTLAVSLTCNCSGGQLLAIFDVKTKLPIFIVFQHGVSRMTTLQNYGSLYVPGTQTLGTYSPGGICMVGIAGFCLPVPVVIGTVTPLPLPGIGLGGLPVAEAASSAGSIAAAGIALASFDKAWEASSKASKSSASVSRKGFKEAARFAENFPLGVVIAPVIEETGRVVERTLKETARFSERVGKETERFVDNFTDVIKDAGKVFKKVFCLGIFC